MDSSSVGKDGLRGLCRSSHVQRLYGSIMSASNHHVESAAILLLGKISALPEKGAALLSAPHRAGAERQPLCPALSHTQMSPPNSSSYWDNYTGKSSL